MKKYMRILLRIAIVICAAGFITAAVFAIDASQVKLNKEKLSGKYSDLEMYDNSENLIEEANLSYSIKQANNIKSETYNAFIAIEDRRFYSHNGIDTRRIIGAAFENLKSMSFKEGASTITQQLIKNTQLTPEKTLFRKTREIKLALELEKNYSKQEIINMYLNVIYFGNGCYGIEKAANYYFGKSANELSLNESAALAAMIKAPATYSPYSNYDKLIKRKNIVLGNMLKYGMISDEQYKDNKEKELKLSPSRELDNEYYDYINATLNEVSDILNISAKEIKNLDYKIFTYLDRDKQKTVYETIKESSLYKDYSSTDSSALIIDNSTCGISALSLNSKIALNRLQRQPGSAIKPVLVYAPAIEYNILTPATEIADEKTDFEGYSPSNYNDKYYGYVSARYSLAKSLNIPAVKILNSTGVEKSKFFAKRCGINFESQDNSLGLALGGFTKGTTLTELASSYIPFSNGGYYKSPKFIKKIIDSKGRTIFSNNTDSVRVMREDTAYLISDMLKDCVKEGTASKLSSLNINLCSKTGTVGNDKFNSDAYNVSYTTENTFLVWMGGLGEKKLDLGVSGGTYPTLMAKNIIQRTYNGHKPQDFIKPQSIIECNIDTEYLKNNHVLKLASDITPERFTKKEYFSTHYYPKEVSDYFSIPTVDSAEINYENKTVNIKFVAKDYLTYEIIRSGDGTEKQVSFIQNKNGTISVTDHSIKEGKTYQYYIKPQYENKKVNKIIYGEVFRMEKIIIPYKLSPSVPSENSDNEDNYDDEDWWKDSDFMED